MKHYLIATTRQHQKESIAVYKLLLIKINRSDVCSAYSVLILKIRIARK